MKKKIIFWFMSVSIITILFYSMNFESHVDLMLDKSGPYIGADFAQNQGYFGNGVTVAIIDTGIDFSHPDLNGFSENGKVIGGYNFVNENEKPNDKNGHGTQVAGIIAADGNVSGIAPKAKILAYKVSDNGESVTSELIVKAIEKAIEDKADIINISLGVNKTNSKIDLAVNRAMEDGVLVIVAAGNDGPVLDTIGSPGRNPNAITVGATYNNITSSLVSTFEINQKQYQVIPMLGVNAISEPIIGKITDGKYGRNYDFDGINALDSILLVERGSDKEDEIVYFSEKESNAANVGASAIVVYNNEPGMYLGDVSESFTIENYKPRIPILSLSQKDGIEIKETLDDEPNGILNVFYNPDYVAFFSSRGPASPFYIKPDLVAPGAFVNSTDVGGIYNFSSGTSFAAPHVAGAAALLLEKYPNLDPSELKAILTTTTVPVTDAYGNDFSIIDAGAGRLNIENAFNAEIIIEPTFLIMTFSPLENEFHSKLSLKGITQNNIEGIAVQIEAPEFIETRHNFQNNVLDIYANILNSEYGEYEGTITINHKDSKYRIPIIFKHVEGSVIVNEEEGIIDFEIIEPKNWKYAKISVINKATNEFITTSLTPKRDNTVTVTEPGEYWIETNISIDNETHYAYDTLYVEKSKTPNTNIFSEIKISEKPIYIIIIITSIIAVIGIRYRAKNSCKY